MSKIPKTRVINRTDSDKSKLCCFGYIDYIVLASALSIAISEELNSNDLNIFATFFTILSDKLTLIDSVKSCSNNVNNQGNSFIAPVPDTAMTRLKSKIKKRKKVKKKYKKV